MKMRKSSMDSIFFLVAMATGTIMILTMAKTAVGDGRPHQNQNPVQNSSSEESTEGKLGANETEGNLTIDFDSGDLAFEREKTRHQLIITKDEDSTYRRFVECRGEDIKFLSAIFCDSMDECEEKKGCLFDKKKCDSSVSVKYGRKCTAYETSSSSYGYSSYGYSYRSRSSDYDSDELPTPSTSTCFKVRLSLYGGHSGIVQCTSEESGVNVTTFDHFNIGYYNDSLLSNVTNVTSDLITTKLYVSSLSEDLNADDNSTLREKNVTLFVDEEVTSLECQVPKLLFHKEGLLIHVYRKDGSTVKLGKEMTSIETDDIFLKAELSDFRVPADMVAFSCSAQRTNSSGEWLEKRINVTVPDLPSELVVKSSECKNMTVNLTSGSKVNLHCELTGPTKQKISIRSHMRKMMNSYSYSTESKSNSMVEFLRFSQAAGENLICKDLDQDYSAKEDSDWKKEHEKYYGDEQKYHFIFNLAPSMPKIYKPSSSIHLIYQEDHVVDQTLFCMFKGEPEPVITWMKNGEELFSMKSIGTRYTESYEPHLLPGNETMEHVKLRLGAKTIQPGDFDFALSGNGEPHVNFSCVARNHFGSDRLDFIITKGGGSANSEKLKSKTTTEKSTTIKTTHSTTTTAPAPPKTTENSLILPSSTTKSSTEKTSTTKTPVVDIESREAGNSESNLNSKSAQNVAKENSPRNEKSQGNRFSKTTVFVTVFSALIIILLLAVFVFWKRRNSGSGGRGILPMPFQNRSSMSHVLLNENPHENL